MTSLFSYVVVWDTGFAPNPFGEFLTLATCKPRIRRVAKNGDWIVGTGSARGVGPGKAVFAAQVSAVVPLAVYGSDVRYASKRPGLEPAWRYYGDNIYFRGQEGRWEQRRNPFHLAEQLEHDVSGLNALVCSRFRYFGGNAPDLTPKLAHLVRQSPGHRRSKSPDDVAALEAWLESRAPGLRGEPFVQRKI